ncbi:MAG: redoxin domain-containing protein [Actinomycetota bacterium]|nr:redoxin domain-containing protein [Actinomycetota bacterium]
MAETVTREAPLAVGDRLPAITLPDVGSGREVRWRWAPSGASIVVFPHEDCASCRQFLGQLDDGADEIGMWGARPLVVLPQAGEAARQLADELGFPVLADQDSAAREACGVSPEQVILFVADRYGSVHEVFEVTGEHAFPPVEDLVEWTKFLGTQCPECGVPDEPGLGEWEPLEDEESS